MNKELKQVRASNKRQVHDEEGRLIEWIWYLQHEKGSPFRRSPPVKLTIGSTHPTPKDVQDTKCV